MKMTLFKFFVMKNNNRTSWRITISIDEEQQLNSPSLGMTHLHTKILLNVTKKQFIQLQNEKRLRFDSILL